jgi:HNH endonuclease
MGGVHVARHLASSAPSALPVAVRAGCIGDSMRPFSLFKQVTMLTYQTITIGARTHYTVKVSPDDYDFLMQWLWTYAVSHPRGALVYARRSVREGDRNVTILMHRLIIEQRMGIKRPSDNHFVDHTNGDSLDNRRVNDQGLMQLRWLTPKENMANQRGIRALPIVASAGIATDIPF